MVHGTVALLPTIRKFAVVPAVVGRVRVCDAVDPCRTVCSPGFADAELERAVALPDPPPPPPLPPAGEIPGPTTSPPIGLIAYPIFVATQAVACPNVKNWDLARKDGAPLEACAWNTRVPATVIVTMKRRTSGCRS